MNFRVEQLSFKAENFLEVFGLEINSSLMKMRVYMERSLLPLNNA
jgi:hypothetical protein